MLERKLKRIEKTVAIIRKARDRAAYVRKNWIEPVREFAAISDIKERVHKAERTSGFRNNDSMQWVTEICDTYNFNPASLILIAEGWEQYAKTKDNMAAEAEEYLKRLTAGELDEELAQEEEERSSKEDLPF